MQLLNPVAGRPRFRMLDYARGIALLLMLVSHALELFPGNLQGNEWSLVSALLLFTKASTPLFVFVFGMTMAFVYYEQLLTEEGFVRLKKRMRRRALLAFLSFEFIVFVVETAQGTSSVAIVRRMAYLQPGNWAEVLNFYVVVLLVGPWVIRWWRNEPPWVRILAIPVLFSVGTVLARFDVPANLFVAKNILTGYPSTQTATAPLDSFPVLQLSAFYLIGLSIGEYLFKQLKSDDFGTVFVVLGSAIPIGILASYLVASDPILEYLRKMALDQYRFPPELAYVLFGLASVLAITLLCLYQLQVRRSVSWPVRAIELIGRHSLFTFNLQYVLLFSVCGLGLDILHRQSILQSLLSLAVVIAICMSIVLLWERWRMKRLPSTIS
jgi:uncharacterized membrane protein YeiB